MKKPTDFTKLLTAYLSSYLPLQRNVSKNTISSYCDTFRLLLTFLRDEKAIRIESLRIRDFSPRLIREYLVWLEQERHCGISTRNQRLAALRAFFKYVEVENPEHNIFYIKDFLGHEDISTTEVYAKASVETQRRALEKHSLVLPPATPSWVTDTDTLEWLKSLGK